MTIKQAAEKFGITPDAIRYYEKIGLLTEVKRTPSKIRDFDDVSMRKLEFITCMRSAGVSIEGLCEYMRLLNTGKSTVGKRKNLLMKERDALRLKRAKIEETLDKLNYKIGLYEEIESGKRKDFSEEV